MSFSRVDQNPPHVCQSWRWAWESWLWTCVLTQSMHPTSAAHLPPPGSLREHGYKREHSRMPDKTSPPTPAAHSTNFIFQMEKGLTQTITLPSGKKWSVITGQTFSVTLSTSALNHRLSPKCLPTVPHPVPQDGVSTNVLISWH